jgi:hypothetical protein
MRNHPILFVAMLSLLCPTVEGVYAAGSENVHNMIKIVAINGKTGKPMAKERLLVFLGNTEEDVRAKAHHFELETDSEGAATLPEDGSGYMRIQVWVDRRTLCQDSPNTRSFLLKEVRTDGITAPNNCGPRLSRDKTPNELIIFARPATLGEKMHW